MALAIGFLLFILGIAALIAWWATIWPFFLGLLVFTLLFWGLLGMVVGFSDRKAQSELKQARKDKPSIEEQSVEQNVSSA